MRYYSLLASSIALYRAQEITNYDDYTDIENIDFEDYSDPYEYEWSTNDDKISGWVSSKCSDFPGPYQREIKNCRQNIRGKMLGMNYYGIANQCNNVISHQIHSKFSTSAAHDFTCRAMFGSVFVENKARTTNIPNSYYSHKVSNNNNNNGRQLATEEEPYQIFGETCGQIDFNFEKIVGGTEIKASDSPWNAYFHISNVDHNGDNESFYCSSTLIGKNHLLTSGHCCELANDIEGSAIVLGKSSPFEAERSILNFEGTENVGSWYDIDSVKIHENFNHNSQYKNNICLIKLKHDVTFSQDVFPICLPSDNECANDGTKLTSSGFGTSEDPSKPYQLRTVELPVEKISDCKWIYSDRGENSWISEENTEMCAGGNEGQGVCEGDEGGPLYKIDDTQVGILHGIFSFKAGNSCAQKMIPAVYTRVTSYLSWIKENSGISQDDFDQDKFGFVKSCDDTYNYDHPQAVVLNQSNEKTYTIKLGSENSQFCAVKGGRNWQYHGFLSDLPIVNDYCTENLESEFRYHQSSGLITSSGFQNLFCWTVDSGLRQRLILAPCTAGNNQVFNYDVNSGLISMRNSGSKSISSFVLSYVPNSKKNSLPLRLLKARPNTFEMTINQIGQIKFTTGLSKYFTNEVENKDFCLGLNGPQKSRTQISARPCSNSNTFDWKFDSQSGLISTSNGKYCLRFSTLIRKRNSLFIDDCAKAANGNNKSKFSFNYSESDRRLVVRSNPRFCVMPFSNFGSRSLVVKTCDYKSTFSMVEE